jgi:hypothetical protein
MAKLNGYFPKTFDVYLGILSYIPIKMAKYVLKITKKMH